MSVTFDELAGSPRYSGGRDSLSATRMGLIDWGDIDAFYLELFPAAVSSNKPSLPALLLGSSVLYADSVEFEPQIGENDVPECLGDVATYTKAKVTIQYKTIPYSQGAGADDQIITRRYSKTGEFMTLPSNGVKWDGDAAAVLDPDIVAGKVVPMEEIIVTLHRVTPAYFTSLKATIDDLIGCVNNATFEGRAAESVLLLGGDFTQTVSADGSVTHQCEIKFGVRSIKEGANKRGWNYFFDPITGTYRRLKTKDGKDIYEQKTFTTLYN